MTGGNGPEPEDGCWVYASTTGCPDRLAWQRKAGAWFDDHGCRRSWDQLVDPIDVSEPGGSGPRWL